MDNYGILTEFRDMDDDESEQAFDSIKRLTENKSLTKKTVQNAVELASPAIFEAITSKKTAQESIECCSFLKRVSRYFLYYSSNLNFPPKTFKPSKGHGRPNF